LEEDTELKIIEQRKMEQMKKRLMASSPQKIEKTEKPERTSRQVVEGVLFDRGDEVLDAAYSFFPEQTERIVEELARMIREGRLKEKVSGGELLSVLRQLGLRFNLKTSIKVQDRGKFVELSEKLKRKEDE
jgi:DNA-binding TFAR19-related protein (PDSD5 family)